MSKISRALEKAARDRILRERENPPVVTVSPVKAPAHAVMVGRTVESQVDAHIVVYHDRHNPIAEQYRMLRTQLQSMKRELGLGSILMTSAFANEGKTVTALNLALTLAQQPDCRVLLIDADIRKGSVNRWLGLGRSTGLSDILLGQVKPQDALVRMESTNLTILPSGPTMEDPSDKLHSETMRSLIQQFKRQFDYVILDAPPLLLVTDPGILAQHVDGVILVVRAGMTPRRGIVEAFNRLEQVKARTIGSILTHAQFYDPLYQKYYRYYKDEQDGQDTNGSVSSNGPAGS